MPDGTCFVEGCTEASYSRGWCRKHYARWYRHGDPLVRKHRHDENRVDAAQSKTCVVCGSTFNSSPGRSHAQWERQQYCSGVCANTWRARQQTKAASTTRREGERWARYWEQQRRQQDREELKAWKPKVWPQCRLLDKPKVRSFLGWYCKSCGDPFVYYTKRAQSPYCVECNEAHHRKAANRRAKQNGARYEIVVPRRVFERDNWRCQLCGHKTQGVFPAPRSPTVDHIIPLGVGGDHTYLNVQCACCECNWRKADGSANDQLRLVA